MQPILSDNVIVRSDLARLCNERRITVALEVGTDLGVFACQFLEKFAGDMLLCVDSYEPYPQMPYERSGDMMMAVQALSRFHGRAKIIPGDSIEVARNNHLPDWYVIGCIYIDADHRYEPCLADLHAWWPRLNAGGIFAGHDFDHMPGVRRAVMEFAAEHRLQVYLTHDRPQSWYVIKPDHPTPEAPCSVA